MGANVVCISRTLAAGGEDIARSLAARLGFRVVDAEVVQRAAERAGVDAGRLREAERRRPLLGRLLGALRPGGGGAGLAGDEAYQREAALSEAATAGGEVTEGRMRALIRAAIEEIAGEGRVVIVAHAASLALGNRPSALRVLVTGSPEARARRLVNLSGASLDETRAAVRDSDDARAAYLHRFHGVAQEAPWHYDLVVSTDLLTPEQAVETLHAAATR